jgi:hypothetical protein
MSLKRVFFAAVLLCFSAVAAQASVIKIDIIGLNIGFQDGKIYDGSSAVGGNHSVGEASPVILRFSKDGAFVGDLTSDVYADLLIDNVLNLPKNGSLVTVGDTSSTNGSFGLDLLQGGATPSCLLDLNLASMNAYYVPANPGIVFVGGNIKTVGSQNLPFNLKLSEADPITISLVGSGLTDVVTSGDYVTSFHGSGTCLVDGKSFVPVPEPVSGILLALFGSLCGAVAILKKVVR